MSSRLRSGQLTSGFTPAMAIEATNAYRQFGTAGRFTPLVVSTPTPTSYFVTTTPILTAGVYFVNPVLLVVGSASGTQLGLFLEIDGVPQPPLLTSATVTDGAFLLSGFPPQDWTAGDAAHDLEFLVSQPAGPGVVTALVGNFTWERKA